MMAEVIKSVLSNGNKEEKEISAAITIPIDDVPKEPEPEAPAVESPAPNAPSGIKMVLTRTRATPDGIFGQLCKEDGTFFAYTLEHSYETDPGVFKPKVAKGVYICVKGQHKLEHSIEPFTAFELQNVPDFQGKSVSGILLHIGNRSSDSSGCFLLGMGVMPTMVTNSKKAFEDFMNYLQDVNNFELTVE